MRTKEFLNSLAGLLSDDTLNKASELAQNPIIKGGWEVWLQVEIAFAFSKYFDIKREVQYPNLRQKCDFLLSHRLGQTDETYLELKCINSASGANPFNDALKRFEQDLNKIRNATKKDQTINAIALLATYGNPIDLKNGLGFLSNFSSQFELYILDKSIKHRNILLAKNQEGQKEFLDNPNNRFVIFAMPYIGISSSKALGSSKEPILLNGMKVIFDEEVPVQPITLKDVNDSRPEEERFPEPPRSAGGRYQDHPRYTTDRPDPLLRYRRPKKIHL